MAMWPLSQECFEILSTLTTYVWASLASTSLLRVVTSWSRFVNELWGNEIVYKCSARNTKPDWLPRFWGWSSKIYSRNWHMCRGMAIGSFVLEAGVIIKYCMLDQLCACLQERTLISTHAPKYEMEGCLQVYVGRCELMQAFERERERERISGIRTQDLQNTSQTLLPLSHVTHSRGAEQSLHVATGKRPQPIPAPFSQVCYTVYT